MKNFMTAAPTNPATCSQVGSVSNSPGSCSTGNHRWQCTSDDGTIWSGHCLECGVTAEHQYRSTSGL
jgi:hypothetical protein